MTENQDEFYESPPRFLKSRNNAQKLGKEFTVDNIFFDVDSFLDKSVGVKYSVFVIDEAAFDFSSKKFKGYKKQLQRFYK